LPSIVARKCSRLDQVIITDDMSKSRNEKLLELIKQTLELNDIEWIDQVDEKNEIRERNNSSMMAAAAAAASKTCKNSYKIRIIQLDWQATASFDKLARFERIDHLIGSDVFFDSACK
jgi:transcription initiation factor TFIIIB Brf1 subunit/transcription initiation factor TFIIB